MHLACEDSIARYASPFGMGCQQPECQCMEEHPPTSFRDRLLMSWEVLMNMPDLFRLYPNHDVEILGHEVKSAIRRIWRAP